MNFDRHPAIKIALKKSIGIDKKREFHNARILHDLECIFIHIPKTAGSTITKELKKQPIASLKSPKIGKHAKAWEVRHLLGPHIYDHYFSFSFVRNPWDLMVSCYHWWLQKAVNMPQYSHHVRRIQNMQSFDEFIQSNYGKNMINERHGNYYEWLTEKGRPIVDFVGTVETLQQDWEHICEKTGMSVSQLGKENVTKRRNYREYYTDTGKQIVAERFAWSIEHFGYTF